MRDDLGISLAFEGPSAGAQLFAQAFEILDNPIVDQRQFGGRVRMGIVRCRRAMRGPAGVGDADIARRIVRFQHGDQVGQLAFGAATDQLAIVDRAYPGAIIAAIFHSFQPVDQTIRDGFLANNSNYSAHGCRVFRFKVYKVREFPAYWQGSLGYCALSGSPRLPAR